MNYENFSVDLQAVNIIMQEYPVSPKVFMRSFGCQQNVNDGERIRGILASIGYTVVEVPEDADLIIFNTCAVREHAQTKVLGNIGELKHLKVKNEKLMIAVCGCMVQQKEMVEKLRKSYSFVDLVFGPNSIDELPNIISQNIKTKKRILNEPSERTDIIENIPVRRTSKTSAWVPIMYGCDNFCSYCIVPYVRGRERSRRKEDIIAEFTSLVKDGYTDITLLGQNVNSYGKGLDENMDFADLLSMLAKVEGDYIINFMSSHPKDLTYKLLDVIAENSNITRRIHLPIQSGSNRILKEMNRKYTREEYLDLVNYAKDKIPNVSFSSDILVGFPGETEEDFLETLSVIEEVGYSQLFTFIYSKRTGTKAATMPDSTPEKEKSERIMRIKKQEENYQ